MRSQNAIESIFRLNPARPQNAPTGNGFKHRKKPGNDQEQPPQRIVAGNNDAGNKAKPAHHTAGHAPLTVKIGPKKFAHAAILNQLRLFAKYRPAWRICNNFFGICPKTITICPRVECGLKAFSGHRLFGAQLAVAISFMAGVNAPCSPF